MEPNETPAEVTEPIDYEAPGVLAHVDIDAQLGAVGTQ